MSNSDNELLFALQSLSDKNRLLILRYVNQQEYTVGELAKMLELTAPTISHHLTCLRSAELVTLRTEKNQHFYSLNQGGLKRCKQLLMEIEKMPTNTPPPSSDNEWIENLKCSDEDRKVLLEYTQDGILTHLPSKQKKIEAILRWLISLFENDRLYTEAEVNRILRSKYEEDYVSLRRDLVDLGYLKRERGGGKYWLSSFKYDDQKLTRKNDER